MTPEPLADSVAVAWSAVCRAVAVSGRAPLSARHALHAAVLMDQVSDIGCDHRGSMAVAALTTAGDLAAFRAALRVCAPSLGPIMDLTACGPVGPWLEVVATEVAAEEFAGLPVADLMISLYNDGKVARLMLVQRDGVKLPMQPLLQAAMEWWGGVLRL